MRDPVELPSPVEPAKVDAWVLEQLQKGERKRSKLERDLPTDLRGSSAFLAISHSLIRLQKTGTATLVNGVVKRVAVKP